MNKYLWLPRGLHFEAPTDKGGADNTQGDDDPKKPDDDSDNTDDDAGDESPKDGKDKKAEPFSKGQQTLVDKIVGDARTKAREQSKAEFEAAQKKATDDAEAKRLEEQGKFEELATERQTRIEALEAENATLTADLETVKTAHDAREDVIKKILDERRKDLPKHIIALLDDQDSLKQLEYLTENADALQKDNGSGKGTPGKRGAKPPKDGKEKKKSFLPKLPKI